MSVYDDSRIASTDVANRIGTRNSIKLLTLLAALALPIPAQAGEIRGTALGVDGDTVRLDGERVRLCGINAAETNTRAGQRARAAMSELVDGRQVRCVPVGSGTPCDGRSPRSSYQRVVAQCFVGRVDIAGDMVRQDHAEDWPRYSGGFYAR